MLGISWKEHRIDISILEEIDNGEGGSDETTVLRTRYQGKCRKFGTDNPGVQCMVYVTKEDPQDNGWTT